MRWESSRERDRATVAHELELAPVAPFHFDGTFFKPDHFPSGDNEWRPGLRRQTMVWQGRWLGLEIADAGSVDEPRIRLTVWASERLPGNYVDGLVDEVTYRWGLASDLAEFTARFAADPVLGPAIERLRGLRPATYTSLYEYLAIAIVLQNATVRRSVQMLQALFEGFGSALEFGGTRLFVFWPPEALAEAPEAALRALKLGYRAVSLKRVSAAVAARELDELELRAAPLERQREALLALYGIGPASVGYLLADVFHQLDELRHLSPWEQKILSRVFFGAPAHEPVPSGELLRLFAERFAGYRALALHYVWEDLWWRHYREGVDWLEKLIRL